MKNDLLKAAPTTIAPASSSIGFRLDASSQRLLRERAADLGVSPHALARHYVCLALHEEQTRVLTHELLQELQDQLGEARQQMCLAVETLLFCAGKVSKPDAHQWVTDNLQ